MHRLTARLLLFFALVGNLAPLALAAAAAAPSHTCCLRKGVHRCHDSLTSETGQLVIRDSSCCNHDCCQSTVSAQWAHPRSQAASFFVQVINGRVAASQSHSPATASASFQSTRAPPAS
ncbi:MAG: hypothetical protein WAL89_05015 [Candidatus Sulfotelmatobacter sp.]